MLLKVYCGCSVQEWKQRYQARVSYPLLEEAAQNKYDVFVCESWKCKVDRFIVFVGVESIVRVDKWYLWVK